MPPQTKKIPDPHRRASDHDNSDPRLNTIICPDAMLLSPVSESEDRSEQPEPAMSFTKRKRENDHSRTPDRAHGEPSKKPRSENNNDDAALAYRALMGVSKAAVKEELGQRFSEHTHELKEYVKEREHSVVRNTEATFIKRDKVAATQEEHISALQVDVAKLRKETNDLMRVIKALATLEHQFDNFSKIMTTMSRTQNNFKITCTSLETKFDIEVKGLKSCTEVLKGSIKDMKQRLDTVEVAVVQYETEKREVEERHKNAFAQMEEKYESVLAQVEDRHKSDLAQVEEQHKSALSRIEELTARVARIEEAKETPNRENQLIVSVCKKLDGRFEFLEACQKMTSVNFANKDRSIDAIVKRQAELDAAIPFLATTKDLQDQETRINTKIEKEYSAATKLCKDYFNKANQICFDRTDGVHSRITYVEDTEFQCVISRNKPGAYPSAPTQTPSAAPSLRIEAPNANGPAPRGASGRPSPPYSPAQAYPSQRPVTTNKKGKKPMHVPPSLPENK